MKKYITAILMICLLCGFTACGKEENREITLYDRGLEVVSLLEEMARNEEYIRIFTVNDEISAIIEKTANGDYCEPAAVYEILIPTESIASLYEEAGALDGMSEELKRMVEQKMIGSVISQINAMGGAENLAASAVCTAGTVFTSEELKHDTIYLYVYENTAPVAVTFTKGDENIVSASGNYLTYEEFSANSAEEITVFFENMGATVTDISGGQ